MRLSEARTGELAQCVGVGGSSSLVSVEPVQALRRRGPRVGRRGHEPSLLQYGRDKFCAKEALAVGLARKQDRAGHPHVAERLSDQQPCVVQHGRLGALGAAERQVGILRCGHALNMVRKQHAKVRGFSCGFVMRVRTCGFRPVRLVSSTCTTQHTCVSFETDVQHAGLALTPTSSLKMRHTLHIWPMVPASFPMASST